MKHYGIEPDLIGIELTESCMAGEGETVAGELNGLRELGVKLLVDDFGTGYSSLSQLQRLNVDVLKVNRAFTLTLCDGNEGKALFKAIVSIFDLSHVRFPVGICGKFTQCRMHFQPGQLDRVRCFA
jgi:EAL domain-containing protein (putative c-di-GMP-specific phosphodiesterase class I)